MIRLSPLDWIQEKRIVSRSLSSDWQSAGGWVTGFLYIILISLKFIRKLLKHFIKANFFPEGGWELCTIKKAWSWVFETVSLSECVQSRVKEMRAGWILTPQWSLTLCEGYYMPGTIPFAWQILTSFILVIPKLQRRKEAQSLSSFAQVLTIRCDFFLKCQEGVFKKFGESVLQVGWWEKSILNSPDSHPILCHIKSVLVVRGAGSELNGSACHPCLITRTFTWICAFG